ncbi:hypothetical protein BDM02DRAFT_3132728 [Thelephora ganbajun]|uniref:Uncharacterized protein n=1 Tax=Thelephora ganbajun TaxID=370292 RepID=A0ACB6YZW6_THEGA|nr:hypothetical protein BDM02DRAFT_3132728 [Thelephora ganbajun]
MDPKLQRRKHQGSALSSLNTAVEATNVAEERAGIAPVKAAFGSVTALLMVIRDSMTKKADYVELGLACADVCGALDQGVNGRREDQISESVFEAIERLTTTVTEVKRNVDELGKRNAISRLFHAKDDKETIAAWRLDLNRILHVFNTELAINTHVIVSDVHQDVTNTRAVISDVHQGVVNTHAIVSELQHSVTNTHTIVSDIHRTIVKGQEASEDKGRLFLVQSKEELRKRQTLSEVNGSKGNLLLSMTKKTEGCQQTKIDPGTRYDFPLSNGFDDEKYHTPDIVRGLYGMRVLVTVVPGHEFCVDRKIQAAPIGWAKVDYTLATFKSTFS